MSFSAGSIDLWRPNRKPTTYEQPQRRPEEYRPEERTEEFIEDETDVFYDIADIYDVDKNNDNLEVVG